MAIESECEGCGVQLRVADEHAGRQARCPQCGVLYTVPQKSSAPQPNAAPPNAEPPTAQPLDTSPESSDGHDADSTDGWYVQTPEGQTYGPVDKDALDRWTTEGRVNAQCKLRKPGSQSWQSAVYIYPQLGVSHDRPDNPFQDNPYSSPKTKGTGYRQPHRGAMVLVFGILGFLVCILLSPIAWIMGRNDLKSMDAGVMDPEGRTLTQVGMILGIINSCLLMGGLAFGLLWLLFAIGFGAMNM